MSLKLNVIEIYCNVPIQTNLAEKDQKAKEVHLHLF